MEKTIKLAEAESCVGCSVCADVCHRGCISMKRNEEGFLYPSVDKEKCISCGRCTSACPALQEAPRNSVKRLYAAWMNDSEKRKASTSGGAFQGLAERVLDRGGVVFGAAFDGDFRLVHTQCENMEDLRALLGSKYLQSDTQGVYKAVDIVAKSGRTVLFSGTPCQCDALVHFYSSMNKSVPDNVLTCEIMCHGVSSPGVFEDYVAYIEAKKKKKIVSYNFRYKELRGWSSLCECITYSDGKKDAHRAKYDAWHCWFGAHLSVRKSCYSCNYRDTARVADITLGDFWSIGRVMPELETRDGVSAIFVNTEKGQKHLDACAGLLTVKEIDVSRLDSLFNVPIRKGTVTIPGSRTEFFAKYNTGGIRALMKGFPPLNKFTAIIARIKWMIKK